MPNMYRPYFRMIPSNCNPLITEVNKPLAEAESTSRNKFCLIIAYASNFAKAFLIVKEISHLAYIKTLKENVFDSFSSEYTLETASKQPSVDLLFNTSLLALSIKAPRMSFTFRNFLTLLDWAGYWHITPALARMLSQNVLTKEDKYAFSGNINALNQAQKQGLLMEDKPGVYRWNERIGPFDQGWIQIMREIDKVPHLVDPTE